MHEKIKKKSYVKNKKYPIILIQIVMCTGKLEITAMSSDESEMDPKARQLHENSMKYLHTGG